MRTTFFTAIVFLLGAATLFPRCGYAAKPYAGAEYRTKASFLYGRFETRMKTNGREGALASFFTYNDSYPSTAWNEIDIEILGRYNDEVQFNTITPGQTNHVSHVHVTYNPALEYHVYGFEWTPTYVAWFVDSVEVYRQTASHIATLNIAQKLMMNVWIPNAPTWVGPWNDVVLPTFASYDWIRYASYTPGAGTMGTGGNFTVQWKDDLDSLDASRWEKGNHTFDGNNCDFIPANIVFQNGTMALCLTKAAAPGYVDQTPPSALWGRVEGDTVRLYFSEEVEQSSAETPSNYILTKGAVTAARLLSDQRTVLLTVPGIDTSSVTNIIERNIRDRWSIPNAMSPSVTSLIRSPRLTFPVKINVGGPATLGYLADQDWSPSVEFGRLDGTAAYHSGVSIIGTAEPEIYRSETYGLAEYKVRVPMGKCRVTLMMCENYFTGAGQRTQAIWVGNTLLESKLDLVVAAGFQSAFAHTMTVDVPDGVLSIHFQGIVDNPLLNGLIIVPITTGVGEEGQSDLVPKSLRLLPNFPNPFNGGTRLSILLPKAATVALKVFDILGRVVRDESLGALPQGRSEFYWDARDDNGNALPSGAYFCVVEATSGRAVQKVMYMK